MKTMMQINDAKLMMQNFIDNNKRATTKSFEYKTKLMVSTPNNDDRLDAEVVILLEYLSNFWRSAELLLFNCQIEVDISWSGYCIISEISRTSRTVGNLPTSATFQINIKKYNLKQGFKRTISWGKHRSEIKTQTKNNNLDHLIEPTFNTLFVPLFKKDNDDSTKNYFHKYYMTLVEIKEFNALVNNKLFFDDPVKNNEEALEKLVKCQGIITIQQEFITLPVSLKLLVQIYQDKQIQVFLNILILLEN